MCDTFVALPDHTSSGNLVFAKNSDREPNEAQAILRLPARRTSESSVHCTYITIPQVTHTYEVILSKPFQMWGAEMGANEHGLVIGNEAVFTKCKTARTNTGLTGMDLVRLALERCRTAKHAVQMIADLIEQYGQDACGGYQRERFFYHNSFLIADAGSAWVLETADRHWVAEAVDGFRSISNGLTIESDYDLISAQAIDFAIQQGWAKSVEPFNFRAAYSDWWFTKGSNCRRRQQATTKAGQSKAGRFDVYYAIEILSSHASGAAGFCPSKSSTASICMHPTGWLNPSQTNGSMIAEIRPHAPPTIWLTGTSMPCLSVYVPYFFGDSETGKHPLTPSCWNSPSESLDDSLWWQAERLHRRVCCNYAQAAPPFTDFRSEMQHQLLISEKQLSGDIGERHKFSSNASEHVRTFIRYQNSEMMGRPSNRAGWRYRRYWNRINRQVGIHY
jgi:dipeptidase